MTYRPELPADFDPKPTKFTGGIKRMMQIWETLRKQNQGGYGGSICQAIQGWQMEQLTGTTCSPFTANTIGMLFDKEGKVEGSKFQPVYDNGNKNLPHLFYSLHQGHLDQPAERGSYFRKHGWGYANYAVGSTLLFNLGYEIEAKDMRRGDLVDIDWHNGNGHAVFVWDVHLDDKGDVDAFCLISSNGTKVGTKYSGYGITIHGCGGKKGKHPKSGGPYITGDRGSYDTAYKPLFADRPSHIVDATWYVLPPKLASEVDLTSFKEPGPPLISNMVDRTWKPKEEWTKTEPKKRIMQPTYAERVRVCRFYGILPPDRKPSNDRQANDWQRARDVGGEPPPPSYATGKGKAPEVHIENVHPAVAKGSVDKVKDAPPKKASQHSQRPTEMQLWVEAALEKLYEAKWIDKGPGDTSNVNDQETKDAIKDFKQKFNVQPVDDVATPATRQALEKALADLKARTNPPHVPTKPLAPKIEDAAFLTNRIEPGGSAYLYVHGTDLGTVKTLHISLQDKKSKHTESVEWKMQLDEHDVGKTPVKFPAAFKQGAEIIAKLSGQAMNGAAAQFDMKAAVYVGHVARDADEWPWDERLWTAKMRDISMWCRKTQKPSGPFQEFEITQYGVKEKLEPGDVPVKSPDGTVFGHISRQSLLLADIEGTMRLDGRILNIAKSGNVYEEKQVEVAGKMVTKRKPNREKFDPNKSRWVDVTSKAPWGSGSKQPLVPFRTLALNPKFNKALYGKLVYIKQLDGMKMPNGEIHNGICICGDAGGMRKEHFDLFVGREDHHISIPSIRRGGGTICEIQILG